MDTMEERWLPIKDYEGLYEVSDLGRVRGLKRGKILAGDVVRGGYLQVGLYSNKTRKYVLIHRLVLQTFLPTNDEKLECDHENSIRNDNRLCNLRWATHSQNQRHQLKREGLTSRFIGVSKNRIRWRAYCSLNGKQIHIGRFKTEEEAAEAYDNFVIEHNLQDFTILNSTQGVFAPA